ncbi:hypothetical protein EMPS_03590 [Entomortierella parvispora]|uniref:Uncharacterized protein n=1 Tax=Entomortierella parvispora TaxID=205924 RepID=A0A9P3H744_9FUNG|nr:hypothetical protein EMPS_03590 [Entomortierella parvispora]
MNKALDPLRRLVVQFNARFAQAQSRALASTNIPPAPPHLHHAPSAPTTVHHPSTAAPLNKLGSGLPIFGQFQAKVAVPYHKDGPLLLAHLNQKLNFLARNVLLPEPARVAAVNYACRSAGRPQMASLLSRGSQRMMHHQPLKFAVPHGFVRNVGLSSTRGFCSSVQPAVNGPARMLAQMYAKPLGILPNHAQKLSPSDGDRKRSAVARKRQSSSRKAHKAQSKVGRLSSSTIRSFLARATLVEQQHQFLDLCGTNKAVSTATAISLAKVVGKTCSDLNLLPKLKASEYCPTNVDMCFLLDASPLWHLDTMVSALHTDSLRAPKQLNGSFIEDLLQITNAQYQHFLEVSAILQKLVQCPEAREISLEGYELRVHFLGTTLFDMTQFLRELSIDPKSPHFDLDEYYADMELMPEQYFPQASVNQYYAPSLSDNETWDECSSLQSSLMMYGESERCSSVASFATMDALPEPWEGAIGLTSAAATEDTSSDLEVETDAITEDEEEEETPQDIVETVEAPMVIAVDFTPAEDPALVWTAPAETDKESMSMIQESTRNLNQMSSHILTTEVTEGYFDDIRGFLESLDRHNTDLFSGAMISPSAL